MKVNYENLPRQTKADVDEIVTAYYDGGANLAERVFRAIVEARELKNWEAIAVGGVIRARLARLGYLQIV